MPKCPKCDKEVYFGKKNDSLLNFYQPQNNVIKAL